MTLCPESVCGALKASCRLGEGEEKGRQGEGQKEDRTLSQHMKVTVAIRNITEIDL